jgi:hypothetical protein
MIIISLLLLNIFFINSTYIPHNSIEKYNLRGKNINTNKTICIPHNSLKSYNLRNENRTTISTINNSLFYDFISFHYFK